MSNASQRIADLSPAEKRALLAKASSQRGERGSNRCSRCPIISRVYGFSTSSRRRAWFTMSISPRASAPMLDIPALAARVSGAGRSPSRRCGPLFACAPASPLNRSIRSSEGPLRGDRCVSLGRRGLKTRLLEEAYRPFDLERGPVLRVNLFTASAQEHVLSAGSTSHRDRFLVARGAPQLNSAYCIPAEKAGVPAVLPALDSQYTDYVRWQAEMLAGPEGERLWSYWRKQLAGQLPLLDLPTDRPRPPVPTYRGASSRLHI